MRGTRLAGAPLPPSTPARVFTPVGTPIPGVLDPAGQPGHGCTSAGLSSLSFAGSEGPEGAQAQGKEPPPRAQVSIPLHEGPAAGRTCQRERRCRPGSPSKFFGGGR